MIVVKRLQSGLEKVMFKLNDGIILEDVLISFLVLSTFLILMTLYLSQIYELKVEIKNANDKLMTLKACALATCDKSSGNNYSAHCEQIEIKGESDEVCIYV